MTTDEERFAIRFLDYLYANYGDEKHIKRMAPSIGPMIWKIFQVSKPSLNRVRQIRFNYKGNNFKARYSHHNRGRFEIVETIGRRDGRTVCTITNLTEAMRINLKRTLDDFIST